MSEDQAKYVYVYRYMVRLSPHASPIAVESSFNGLAIYRTSFIRPCCQYDGTNDICEHVSFHQCIRSHGGKMYIHPRMLNGM
jgi:hypothetical protein